MLPPCNIYQLHVSSSCKLFVHWSHLMTFMRDVTTVWWASLDSLLMMFEDFLYVIKHTFTNISKKGFCCNLFYLKLYMNSTIILTKPSPCSLKVYWFLWSKRKKVILCFINHIRYMKCVRRNYWERICAANYNDKVNSFVRICLGTYW